MLVKPKTLWHSIDLIVFYSGWHDTVNSSAPSTPQIIERSWFSREAMHDRMHLRAAKCGTKILAYGAANIIPNFSFYIIVQL